MGDVTPVPCRSAGRVGEQSGHCSTLSLCSQLSPASICRPPQSREAALGSLLFFLASLPSPTFQSLCCVSPTGLVSSIVCVCHLPFPRLPLPV